MAFVTPPNSEFPNGQTAFRRSKPDRRERNFWMQRPGAINRPKRPLMSAETERVERTGRNPRRNGLSSVDDGFCGSLRLDGGVRSQIRTGLRLANSLLTGNFTGNFAILGLLEPIS
jgi:hypothetical protein